MRTNFNLRDKKSQGETLILLIIRWENCKLAYSSKERINPKYFDLDKNSRNYQRVKESRQFPEHPEFNARLNWIESTAKNIFRKFLNDNNNRPPRVEELKQLLDIHLRKVEQKQKKDLFGFIDQFISEAKNRFNSETGKKLSGGTIDIYKNTLFVLKEYAAKKQKLVDFDTIDVNWYQEFTEYLAIEKNYSQNSIAKHIKTLKSFLNDASERGFNNNLSFKSKKFKVLTENTDAIYLNADELDELVKLDLSGNEKLEIVRDLFVCASWTGLRFSDWGGILSENIQGEYIEIKTKKTGETVVIPRHPTVKLIMEKYKSKYANSLPPSLSNVLTNRYLKEIGQLLECFNVPVQTSITKGGVFTTTTYVKHELICTHTARRSFATNLYKSGLSSITIMRITGHKTEKSFLRYIKVTPNENAFLLQQHWKKMEETTQKNIKKVA